MSIDTSSQIWRNIKAAAEARLENTRNKHEAPGCKTEQSHYLRGAINELKWLLALPAQPDEAALWTTPPRED